jgi:WD40 repeat protein/DNA-binding SARP family transcriptional activator
MAADGARMSIEVLGPLAVDGDTGALTPRDRTVLAALVTSPGETLSAEQLADALWGDDLPASWAKIVQGCVARIRKRLGREAIQTVGHGYRFALPDGEVDAVRLERALARVQELEGLGEPARAVYVAEDALRTWRGRPLADLDGWEPGRREAERLEEVRCNLEELRLQALLHAGRWRDVLSEARTRIREVPSRERRWALLALAEYQGGRQADALATLREARRTLAVELGLDPGPELLALEQAILRQDPDLDPPPTPGKLDDRCPWQGLLAYDVDDSERFFGRQDDLRACLDRLAASGVLAVVGASGSGKSSLVRAGVAAALRREGREVVVITPGRAPLDSLSALAGRPVALVVDQAEEVVTQCDDEVQRAGFLSALAVHAERAPVVLALRADRLGELTDDARFARLLERGLYLLTPMSSEDVRVAIEEPARQAGLLLEPGLVDLLLRDVEDAPGALPLLSHALRQTWLVREGRALTVAGYRSAGGIRGAVARTAEELHERTPAERRPLLRDLLLRLVVPEPDGELARRRVPRDVLTTDRPHAELVEDLVRARLLTSDQDSIELAHEALTRAWPRLRAWLDADREGQLLWRHLAAASATWQEMRRPDSELYRGVRLAKATDWRERTSPDLTPLERDFLDTSAALSAAEGRARSQRRRVLTAVVTAAAVAAVAFGGVAVVQARRATVHRDRAVAAEDTARARELTAQGIAALDTDPRLAKLLGLAAADTGVAPSVDLLALLHRAIEVDPLTARLTFAAEDDDAAVLEADLHPDGRLVLLAGSSAGASSRIEVHDLTTDELLWRWPDTPQDGVAIADSRFTPDGEQVLVGVMYDPSDGVPSPESVVGIQVRDAATGELLEVVDVGRCGGFVGDIAPTLAAFHTVEAEECGIWGTWTGWLLDLGTYEPRELTTGPRTWLALSDDGSRVAYAPNNDGTIVVEDTDRGERSEWLADGHGFTEADGTPWEIRELDADGSRLLTGDRRIAVWDVETQEPIATFAGHGGDAQAAVFDVDGRSVLTPGRDGGVWRWDATRGDRIEVFRAVGGGHLARLPDGRMLVTDPPSRTASLLDPTARAERWQTPGCGGSALAWSLNRIGEVAAFTELCDEEWTTFVVDLATRELLHRWPGHTAQMTALSPDGRVLVRQEVDDTGANGAPVLRDVATGEPLRTLEGVCAWVPGEGDPVDQPGCVEPPATPAPLWMGSIDWAPNGDRLAVGNGFRGLLVWDASDGSILHSDDHCPMIDAMFTPDADALLLSCQDLTIGTYVIELDADTWQERRRAPLGATIEGTGALMLVGHTLDGEVLLAVGQDPTAVGPTTVLWLDADDLEVLHAIPRAHTGAPKSFAVDEEVGRLATGSSDGVVRVWDVAEQRLVHEFQVGDTQVQGVAFLGGDDLAIATERGGMTVYTLDPQTLIDRVEGSLTRGFTATECARFQLGDTCPGIAAATE